MLLFSIALEKLATCKVYCRVVTVYSDFVSLTNYANLVFHSTITIREIWQFARITIIVIVLKLCKRVRRKGSKQWRAF